MRLTRIAVPLAALLAFGGAGLMNAHASSPAKSRSTSRMVMLKALGGSTVTGTAAFKYNSKSNQTTVTLTVKHLKARSMHPAHIHVGRCGQNGPVIHPFATLRANNAGIAKATATFAGTYVGKKWYVNVHMGPSLTSATQAKPISCGNV